MEKRLTTNDGKMIYDNVHKEYELIDMAFKKLSKFEIRETAKPVEIDNQIKVCFCPTCNSIINTVENFGDQKFCQFCGQRVYLK